MPHVWLLSILLLSWGCTGEISSYQNDPNDTLRGDESTSYGDAQSAGDTFTTGDEVVGGDEVQLAGDDALPAGDETQVVPFWHQRPAVFRFTTTVPAQLDFSHMIDNPHGLDATFTAVGSWPVVVAVNGAAETLDYDGGAEAPTTGLRIRATAGDFVEDSPLIDLTFVAENAIPTVTYGMVQESSVGTDSIIAWQSAFLTNDGRIVSFGTGNHVNDQSNAVRVIDPVANAGELSTYDLFPWTQDREPPEWRGDDPGNNLYVSNYDNDPSIYLPPDDVVVWFGHGVFDVGLEEWLYGNRPPFTSEQNWDAYVYVDTSIVGNFQHTYNPAVAYCEDIETGVLFGASDGGYGQDPTDLARILRHSGEVRPQWYVEFTDMGDQGVEALHLARNTAVCIGTTLYVGGPADDGNGNRFYAMNVADQTLLDTLTPYPEGERYPQMVYDSRRDRLVVIGKGLYTYSFADDRWTDVTPEGWGVYTFVNGVYHPALDAIFFRGRHQDYSCCAESERRDPAWGWNRIVFTD